MDLPKIGERQLEYQNQYQKVFRVSADFGDFKKEYFVTETGDKAGIVAVRDNHILLVRQYRLLINGLSWEIPGGKVDEGETPVEAAVRECLEESGVRCLDVQPLVFFHAGMDTRHNPTHIFQSNNLSEKLEPEMMHNQETSGYEWVPLERATKMVFKSEIQDSFSIVGILAYQAQSRTSAQPGH